MTAAVDDTLEALLSAAAAIWPAPARVESPDDAQPHPSDRSDESQSHESMPADPATVRQPADQNDPPAPSTQHDGPEEREPVTELLVVPSLARPRLVVPANAPRVAAAAFTRDSDDVSTRTRLVRAVAARALRVPGVASVLRHPRSLGSRDNRSNRLTVTVPGGAVVRSLQRRLSELVDTDVQLCFGVGSPRANRKPVVQAVDQAGRTVAWTKLGLDAVSRDLVRGEAEALRAFWSEKRPLRHLEAPRVLYAGPWGDAELLVLSPLRPASRPVGGRGSREQTADVPAYAASAGSPTLAERPRRGQLPREAMNELGERLGTEIRPLADTEFWRKIRKVPELADPAAMVEAEYGQRMVMLGSWHGDWTPWNMRTDRNRVLLWDFERFAYGVPVGLDVAHFRFQSALHTGGERAAERLLIDGPLVDEPGGELLTSAYLLELARRWVRAAEPDTGAPLRARAGWLLRVLEAWLPRGPEDWTTEPVQDR